MLTAPSSVNTGRTGKPLATGAAGRAAVWNQVEKSHGKKLP